VQNGTLTNIFWGLFLIWFGVMAAWLHGDLFTTVNHPLFALGTGGLLLLLNLTRSLMRIRLSILTIGLGAILTVVNAPVIFFGLSVPFLPELLIIAGVALVIGAFRTRNFHTY
jgi:hypothetical protein